MVCTKCGHENKKGLKFCTACGVRLPKSRRNSKDGAAGQSQTKVALLAGSILLIALVWGLKPEEGGSKISPTELPKKLYSSAVLEVATKFLCACGTCDVPELVECTCPTAIDEKDAINRELATGKSQNEVVAILNKRFGGIKPQFASMVSFPSPGQTTSTPNSGQTEPSSTREAVKLPAGTPSYATAMDQKSIEQHFICACGECQDHVLSECTCDHPRGAKEMKAFIAYKISQKRFAIEDIVKSVAYEYGHFIEP